VRQGRPRVTALRGRPGSEHHTHLAFSFEVSGSTSLLQLEGTDFSWVCLPGLEQQAPSLLLSDALSGWLLQATPKVRITTQLFIAWRRLRWALCCCRACAL
jgi:hypothetical protein